MGKFYLKKKERKVFQLCLPNIPPNTQLRNKKEQTNKINEQIN